MRARDVSGAERALWSLVLVPYLALAIAVAEIAALPAALASASPATILGLLGRSLRDQAVAFAPCAVGVVVVAIVSAVRPLAPRLTKAGALIAVGAATLAAYGSYEQLTSYPRFEGYPLFIAAWSSLGIALAVAYTRALSVARGRGAVSVTLAVGVLAGVGALVVAYVNSSVYRDRYPTLHWSLLSVVFLLGHAGSAALLPLLRPRRGWIGVSAVLSLALVAATRAPSSPALDPYYHSMTILGKVYPPPPPAEPPCARAEDLDAAAADEVFGALSGYPPTPPTFQLDGKNVLLVLVDTLRASDTCLGSARELTPSLEAFIEDGAFAFERAYAPSSLTLASVSAMFSMRRSSSAHLTIRQPLTAGVLRPEAEVVAEHFARAGYDTFRVVHGIGRRTLGGLDQGFRDSHMEITRDGDIDSDRELDERIADRAIDKLRPYGDRSRRFFGLVFFGGPHDPYASHRGVPASQLELYKEEIVNTDAQIGRVLRAVRELGLYEDTVIVVAGDHGEEFGEHGSVGHARTLYEESIHVPFAVRLPGVRGSRQTRPVSTAHLFPWLLRTGSGPLQEAAMGVIRDEHAPTLRATNGAVVAELLGLDDMQTALVYPDVKLIYEHLVDKLEAYDLARDPGEQVDLVLGAPAEILDWRARVDAYRGMRACHRRFVLER